MRTKTLATITVVAAASLCANGASAGLGLSLGWEFIDNSVNPISGLSPAADPNSPFNPNDWITMRLRLFGEGAQVTAIFMGSAANPSLDPNALFTDGVVYNHALGGNVRVTGLDNPFSALYYDTYLALGDTPPSGVNVLPGSAFLGDPGFDPDVGFEGLRGVWFTSPGEHVTIGIGGVTIMQITVRRDTVYVGGTFVLPGDVVLVSQLEVGTVQGNQVMLIPRILSPTPGTAALFCVAGLAFARRRR